MELSVFTVTYNARELIDDQIRSVVKAAEGLEYEHFVMDNGSTDGTVDYIKAEFPHIKLLENKENLGFGRPHNLAAELASGKFFLCLNPDMVLTPGSLKKLIDLMKSRPEVGIVAPLLTDKQGKVNMEATPRRFPTVLNQLAVLLKLPHIFPSILNHYLYIGYDWGVEQAVDSVRGSFMLLKRDIYDKLGWIFDPRYFIWFEDVDLCHEAQRLGFKVIHTPIAVARDLVGQTFKKQNNVWKQKRITESMVKYFRKWTPWYEWIWIWLARPVGIFLVMCFSRLGNKKEYL